MQDHPLAQSNRRDFLKTSTAALGGVVAANLSLMPRALAQSSDTLKVGLIGCGGRGTGAANQALNADKNVVLTAMGDVFENQLQGSLATLRKEIEEKVKVDPAKCFIGLDAYEKVLASDVDVVILATPPGFRPIHLKAAVAAGKHIFCEKPMATDAPGLRSVLESVAEAKRKKISLVAGFCWRYDTQRREIFRRIHDGQIGDLRAMYSTYYTGPVKPMPTADKRKPGESDLHWQLRNWYNFTWLCGDSLVEQAVHSVDKIMWAMHDKPPVKAVAVGGRQVPANGGNIYDHFEVNYEFENGIRAFMGSRQQSGCYNQNADYIIGSKGTGTIGVGRACEITGENNWRYRSEGKDKDMYQIEHDELFAGIRKGEPINNGDRMCTSTMAALMGRMAAYTGLEVTWEQALNSEERLVPEKIEWDMKHDVPPISIPGITKFI